MKIAYTGVCALDTALLRDEDDASGARPQQEACALGIAGHEGAGMVVGVGKNGMLSSDYLGDLRVWDALRK